ncbi:MAG: transposase [Chloroflexi bacterium]|nr:transposase [Chloroflexota bacterium]
MPEYRRAYMKGGVFFFTVVTYERLPIFQQESAIDLLDMCFQRIRAIHPFNTDALVILPDHLHTIWSLPENDSDFSIRWKKIKATFSRNFEGSTEGEISQSMLRKGERGVWQRRFWEHMIRDQDDFNRHCDYIHYNPVKHGLVSVPSDWRHSTFGEFVEKDWYERDWGGSVPKDISEMSLE